MPLFFYLQPFWEAFDHYLRNVSPPTTDDLVTIMRRTGARGIHADTTYRRRAQTIRRWLDWIFELTDPV